MLALGIFLFAFSLIVIVFAIAVRLGEPPHKRAQASSSNQPPAANQNEIARAIDTYTRHYETDQAETAKHNRNVYWWTRIGIVGGIVYTLLTFGIFVATIRSVKESHDAVKQTRAAVSAAITQAQIADATLKATIKNFQSDERPYIWLPNNIDPPQFQFVKVIPPAPAGPEWVVWNWHYVNYGKTPALNIHFTHYIKVGDRPFALGLGDDGKGTGAPLPPNKNDFSTVISKPELSAEEVAKLSVTEQAIKIFVKISYTDAYGGDYLTTFCLSRLLTGAIAYCQDMGGNQIK